MRVRIWVTFDKSKDLWKIVVPGHETAWRPLRSEAERMAAEWGRYIKEEGGLAQVTIKNKGDGEISLEWTYGKDPDRRKG